MPEEYDVEEDEQENPGSYYDPFDCLSGRWQSVTATATGRLAHRCYLPANRALLVRR